MYGAILGDIIGSPFEFDRGEKTKEFRFFERGCDYTDDTCMSIAVGEALLTAEKNATVDAIRTAVIKSMRKWAMKYPNAGYGGMFFRWLFYSKDPQPYNSFGNGSAMRVSSVGWLYDSLERTIEVAKATAEVTHNHEEGIKGAESTAVAIFLARTGKSKEEILSYIVDHYGYDISPSIEEMRGYNYHNETCQLTMPLVFKSFEESVDFEDAVRNAVSMGGDTDTIAAITGSIAEAYYGIPALLIAEARSRIPSDMQEVMDRFDQECGRETFGVNENDPYMANVLIKEYCSQFKTATEDRADSLLKLLGEIRRRMDEEGEVPMPMIDMSGTFPEIDVEHVKKGDAVKLEKNLRLKMDYVTDGEEKNYVPFYTDRAEMEKGMTSMITINCPIKKVLMAGMEAEVEGIVINPFSEALPLPKSLINIILQWVNDN